MCTLPAARTGASCTLDTVRCVVPKTPLLVNGTGVRGPAMALRLGADRFAGRREQDLVAAVEAVAQAEVAQVG